MRRRAGSDAPLGLMLPGLSHLRSGVLGIGVGLLALDAVLLLALVSAAPRLEQVLFPDGLLSMHAVIAFVAWLGLAASLWYCAWCHEFPRASTVAERNTLSAITAREFWRHRAGTAGFFGVAVIVSLTLLAPMIAPFDPTALDVGPKNTPPSPVHWMGTDHIGRDNLSRLLFGSRLSLTVGLVAVFVATTLGTLVGALAGFVGGVVDRTLMWFTDLMLAVPRLVLLITVAGLFQAQASWKVGLLILMLGLTGWMGVARIVRARVLSVRTQDFVAAARALGMSWRRILVRHVLPNATSDIIVYASLAIGTTILAEAALSFLGLGIPPPEPTWGAMVNDARRFLRSAPWTGVFPGVAIALAVVSFNLFGDGLRDALDPKLRGERSPSS